MDESRLLRQRTLEINGVFEGIKRLRKAREQVSVADRGAGEFLIRRYLDPLAQAIEREQGRVERGARAKYGAALVTLDADKLAFVTLKTILRCVADVTDEQPAVTQAKLIREIGKACENEYAFDRMEKRERDWLQSWLKRVKNRWNAIKQVEKKAKELREEGWPTFYLGGMLVEFALRHTGLIEKRSHAKASTTIHIRKRARKDLKDLLREEESLAWPALRPMVTPPKQWTGTVGGGYSAMEFDLVKHGGRAQVVEALSAADLAVPCVALNALQETPWVINEPVFKLMSESGLEDLLTRGELSTPVSSAPDGDDDEEEVYVLDDDFENARIVKGDEGLAVARKFLSESEIYFPYQLDWRGRAYALPATLHPQSDDRSRALLLFARGKPLGERGATWLAVHLANTFGKDKISFRDRVEWVERHREEIKAAVDHPRESRFLMEAEKPWRFLAAAREWVDYLKQGPGFVSRIPVAMDGTCNGLQHLSALGRDPEGGCWTNLLPGQKPEDIYEEVARRLRPRIEQDARAGHGIAKRLMDAEAIDRKLVKQPTMTMPYGVRFRAIRGQLMGVLRDRYRDRFPDRLEVATYLAERVEKATREVVVKAGGIMDWLRVQVGALAKKRRFVSWVTPTGFPVVHKYPRTVVRRIQTITTALTLREPRPDGRLDTTKIMDAIVPNLVHSLDAAHMMMTVGELKARGLRDIVTVHDSYAVHAADVDLMNEVLRKQFVRVYEEFTLAGFASELRRQAGGQVEIQDPPPPGSLDLGEVLKSEYFFS